MVPGPHKHFYNDGGGRDGQSGPAAPWAVHILLLARPPLPPGPGPFLLIQRGTYWLSMPSLALQSSVTDEQYQNSDDGMKETRNCLKQTGVSIKEIKLKEKKN